MVNYIVGWIISGVLIQLFYIWFNHFGWKDKPLVYVFGAIAGHLMIILIIIAERNRYT